MPMLDQATDIMSSKFSATNINQEVVNAPLFAPGNSLDASYVYPNPGDAVKRKMLQDYLDALPPGIRENIRATIYFALTSRPPRPMKFRWVGAYDYKVEFVETYDTFYSPRTPGVISLTLHGRYPNDPHPLLQYMKPHGRGAAAASKRAATGSPSPAKRKPSRKS
jgi:hypothetical protein